MTLTERLKYIRDEAKAADSLDIGECDWILISKSRLIQLMEDVLAEYEHYDYKAE